MKVQRPPRIAVIVLAMVVVAAVAAVATSGWISRAESPMRAAPSEATSIAPGTSESTVGRPGTTALQTGSRQWFVSPSGADSSAGTRQSPLATAERAASLAKPGDSIVLMAGAHQEVVLDGVNGTAAAPIRVVGESGASVSSGSINSLAAFLVKNSSHIEISNIRVHTALWGFLVEYSNNIDLIDVVSEDVGQEGIKISFYSHHVVVDGAVVRRTGLKTDLPYTGEGIYLGSGRDDIQDTVNNVEILNSEISFTTAEAIDIKAFVYDVVVDGNFIHDIDTFNSGAVVVGIGNRNYPDPSIVIRNNTIARVRATKSPYADANCIALSAAATVYNNVLYDCADRGIYVLRDFPNPAARSVNIWFNTVVSNGRHGDIVDEGVASTSVLNNIGSSAPGNVASDADFFVDPASLDFRLSPSAGAAIDQGTSIGTVESDFRGAARQSGPAPDFGAIELSSQMPTTSSSEPAPPTTAASQSTSTTTSPSTTSPPTTAPSTTVAQPSPAPLRAPEPSEGNSEVSSREPDGSGRGTTSSTQAADEPASSTSTVRTATSSTTVSRSGSESPGSAAGPSTTGTSAAPHLQERDPQLVEEADEASTRTDAPDLDDGSTAFDDPPDDPTDEAANSNSSSADDQALPRDPGQGLESDQAPDQLAFVEAAWTSQSRQRPYSLVAVGFFGLALVSLGVRVHSHRRRGAADL